jgi:nucleotide-binding universal stress UspA family protein
MTKILAAIDNSSAARPVLQVAGAVALLFDAEVEAVHIRSDGMRLVESEARAARVPLRVEEGDVGERLREAALADDMAAVVMGARGTLAGPRPAGSTALELIVSLEKPVVVVPPDAPVRRPFRRMLVPLEGTAPTSDAPRAIVERACGAELDVVVLHVREDIPAFTDQPKHEAEAWAEEFLARFCPWSVGGVRLETRIGLPFQAVVEVAHEFDADAVVLGWSRTLEPGRASVVREALERGGRPVVLVPVAAVSA